MYNFSNPNILFATIDDIPTLERLLNSAYRGESAKEGWTTEVDLIEGDTRTNKEMLHQVITKKKSVILKYLDNDGQIIGCVNLELHDNKLHLGMFSVWPKLQAKGIGKQLLHAAEEYARHLSCYTIDLSVISLRTALIEWYIRRGYQDTGERVFFEEDPVTGKHLQPLEFMIMEKSLPKEI